MTDDTTTVVRRESRADSSVVRTVIARAFTHEPHVPDLWAALARRPRAIGLVAEVGGAVVGHVGLSWGWVDAPERLVDVLVLSPLSVDPAHQRRGVGRALVAAAVETAAGLGAAAVFLEGDPAYYSGCGFTTAEQHGFTAPSVRIPPVAFQVVLLPAYDPTMHGALVYPDTFWAFDSVGLRGEQLAAVLRG